MYHWEIKEFKDAFRFGKIYIINKIGLKWTMCRVNRIGDKIRVNKNERFVKPPIDFNGHTPNLGDFIFIANVDNSVSLIRNTFELKGKRRSCKKQTHSDAAQDAERIQN